MKLPIIKETRKSFAEDIYIFRMYKVINYWEKGHTWYLFMILQKCVLYTVAPTFIILQF